MITNLQDYITSSGLFKTLRVDDLLFVEYRCLVEDPASDIWTHHNYLAYVLGGKKQWKSHREEQTISSGEALFIRKGTSTVYQYFEEPFFVLFVFLPDGFIRQTLLKYPEVGMARGDLKVRHSSLIPVHINQILGAFFQSLFSYFSQPKPPHPSLLRLKMEELMLNVLTQPDNLPLKHYFLQLGQQEKVEIENLMRTNVNRPLSISDYARLSARSLSAFRKDFKAVFHMPPGKWLIRERLQFGKFLLETTDDPIEQVVEKSGFKNRSHFLKRFKASFGLSPQQYRIKHGQGVIS